ncbi:MAG: hypothetical protein E6I69_10370 [Chloroflexi bacterium]|nr:MAG: hypothetical protein E6I69_10370 [Chloroflexota bacterium]
MQEGDGPAGEAAHRRSAANPIGGRHRARSVGRPGAHNPGADSAAHGGWAQAHASPGDRSRQQRSGNLLLLAAGLLLPLGLDTFALAAALGVAGLAPRDRLRVALVFTAFEAGMPIVGILAGRALGELMGPRAEYGAIFFLLGAGALLLWPRGDEDREERHRGLDRPPVFCCSSDRDSAWRAYRRQIP